MDFKKSFCFRSNLSNDDMISGLKSENGKLQFWSEIGSGFEESGGTPHKEFPRLPPPPPAGFGSGEAFFMAWVVVKNISADSNAFSRFYWVKRRTLHEMSSITVRHL